MNYKLVSYYIILYIKRVNKPLHKLNCQTEVHYRQWQFVRTILRRWTILRENYRYDFNLKEYQFESTLWILVEYYLVW